MSYSSSPLSSTTLAMNSPTQNSAELHLATQTRVFDTEATVDADYLQYMCIVVLSHIVHLYNRNNADIVSTTNSCTKM